MHHVHFVTVTEAHTDTHGPANQGSMDLATARAFSEEDFDAREWVEAVLASSSGASIHSSLLTWLVVYVVFID